MLITRTAAGKTARCRWRRLRPDAGRLERDIDQIEATVFSGTVAPTERIYSLRREATDFYRAVHPLLAILATVFLPLTFITGFFGQNFA